MADSTIIIPNNHVAVKPTEDSWMVFAPYLKSAPFRTVNEFDAHSSILYATTSIVGFTPDPNKIFTAKIKGAKIWVDTYMGIKDLVVELESPEMKNEFDYITQNFGVQSVYPNFEPHFALAYDLPDYRSKYKWFINEMINLCSTRLKDQIIFFKHEYVESTKRGSLVTEQNHIDKQNIQIQNP